MVSMGSLPFVVDKSCSILVCNRIYHLPFLWSTPKRSFCWGGVREVDVGVSGSIRGWNGLSRCKIKATRKEYEDVGGDGHDNDAIQAAINKSRKLLAVQKDIIQQIAERRKLVSSINNAVNDSGSLEMGDSSFPSLESAEGHGSDNYEERHAPDFLSGSSHNVSVDELQEDQPSTISEDYIEDAKQNGKGFIFENSSDYGSSKQPITPPSEQAYHHELPTFLSASPSSNPEYQKYENLKDSYVEEPHHDEAKEEYVNSPPLAGANVMNVILVAAECAPWSKTGGLGDVAGALPKALARRGHRVMVVVPLYGNYSEPKNTGIRKLYKVDGQDMEVTYFHAYIDGVDFVFIESPQFRHMGDNIYGGNRTDILKRMVLFCKAAVEVPWHVPCGGVCYGDGNLVFIANDWHTALLPVYLKAYYRDNGLMKYTRAVLVIHNIAHQGRGPLDDFSFVDLPAQYLDLFRMYDPLGGEHFNIFAAGLKTADRVVTVSHGYAWELKTPEGGWGLHGIINENDWKMKGIVNGIDTKDWNPQIDFHLNSDGYTNYSLDTLQTGKPQCKAALQKELGLPVRPDVPLIGFIGRLDHQKGVDLIGEAVPWIVDQDAQLVMLGTGRPDLEQMLRQIESQHRDKIRGWVGFSVKTAHRITAGADILLMPSRFEPCGLNQLYAMSYGTIPVVHGVGGLRDTVEPFNPYEESGVGWTFDRADSSQLIHALGNCLLTYRQYKASWEGLQRRGMTRDLSWDNAAENYEEVLVAAKHHW